MIKIFLAAIILIFTGCGSSQKEATPKQKSSVVKIDKKSTLKKKKAIKNTQPKWINNPNIDGQTGAVGIVKLMKNKKKQKYIAKKLAIASLQEQKRVEVDTKVTTSQRVLNNSKSTSYTAQETHQTSNHYKTYDIIQKDDYSDGENYYIWMVVKK